MGTGQGNKRRKEEKKRIRWGSSAESWYEVGNRINVTVENTELRKIIHE